MKILPNPPAPPGPAAFAARLDLGHLGRRRAVGRRGAGCGTAEPGTPGRSRRFLNEP